MKFGTVLASLSATALLLAQPALAATRSADSLPAPGAKVTSIDSRVGSRVGKSEELAAGAMILPIIGIVGALAFLALVVADEGSFDDVDELPDSPG